MLKNYIYNQKSDEFDHKNFQFGHKILEFKKREDLGDKKTDFKATIFGGLIGEKVQIDTDGQVRTIF